MIAALLVQPKLLQYNPVNHMGGSWVQNGELTCKSKGLMETLKMWHHHGVTCLLHYRSRGRRL
jgi:hypothetical protein